MLPLLITFATANVKTILLNFEISTVIFRIQNIELLVTLVYTVFIFFKFIFKFLIFRERGREEEWEGEKRFLPMRGRGQETWIGCLPDAPWPGMHPDQGWTCNPGMCLNGNWTGDFSVYGRTPNQLSHTARATLLLFGKSFLFLGSVMSNKTIGALTGVSQWI